MNTAGAAIERIDTISSRTLSLLRKHALLTLLVACSLTAGAMVYRIYPLHDDVNAVDSAGNDWLTYKQWAVDILDHGLTIPGTHGIYYIPGGFLYNYFIAGIFAVAGRNSSYVYVVQAFLLPLAVAWGFLFARRSLSEPMTLLYLAGVAAAMYVDLFRWNTGRLLSENIVIVMVPLSAYVLVRAKDSNSFRWYAVAGMVFGLIALTRQNLMMVPIGIAPLILFYNGARPRRRVMQTCVFLAFFLAVFSVLAFRNYAVAGHFTVYPPNYDRLRPSIAGLGGLGPAFATYGKRTLFCLGILWGGLDMVGNHVTMVTHFFLPTAGALGFVIVSLIHKKKIEFSDALCILWLILAYGPFIVMPALGGYGMRFQWPTEPLLYFLFCRFGDVVYTAIKSRSRAMTPAEPAHAVGYARHRD